MQDSLQVGVTGGLLQLLAVHSVAKRVDHSDLIDQEKKWKRKVLLVWKIRADVATQKKIYIIIPKYVCAKLGYKIYSVFLKKQNKIFLCYLVKVGAEAVRAEVRSC